MREIILDTETTGLDAASGDRIFFVESRDDEVMRSTTGRIGTPALWNRQFLVALDTREYEPLRAQIGTGGGR